jgi:CRP-like cAMP-binding protein
MRPDDNTLLEELFKNANRHHYKKGTPITFDSDRLFFALVAHGYVKRYLITDEGIESIQAIYGPKTAFPLTPVFSVLLDLKIYEGDEVLYYETMTDTIVYSLSKLELQEAVDAHP